MDTQSALLLGTGAVTALGALIYTAPSRAWKVLAQSLENRVTRLEDTITRLETGIRDRDRAIEERDRIIRRMRDALHRANNELFKAGLAKLIVEPKRVIARADDLVPDRRVDGDYVYDFQNDEDVSTEGSDA